MPEPTPTQDALPAATLDMLRGDRAKLQEMLAGVRQRAGARAREELQRRIDAILPSPPPKAPAAPAAKPVITPKPIPRASPDWPVDIRLPNGRTMRASIAPSMARRDDLDAVGRAAADNDRQAAAVIQRQSDALDRLHRSHDELEQRVAALQEQSDQLLLNLLQGLAGFDQKLRDVVGRQEMLKAERVSARTAVARQRNEIKSLETSGRIQQVNAVIGSVQSAAYGDKGSLFTTNNLLLAGNQLFWMFFEPALRGLGVITETSPSLFSWLTPIGSLVTGHLALGNRQHDRFVTGVSVFAPGDVEVVEPLRPLIADSSFDDFRRRTNVPVTVTRLEGMENVTLAATVDHGLLRITAESENLPPGGRAAWMVDTGADGG